MRRDFERADNRAENDEQRCGCNAETEEENGGSALEEGAEDGDARPESTVSETGDAPKRTVGGLEKRLTAVKNSAPFHRWDVFVYAVLLVLIASILLAVFLPKPGFSDSAILEVYLDGEKVTEYRLNVDAEVQVKSGDTVLLTLVIKDKTASVKGSKCDDHLCEKMIISGRNKQIICLPNKVVIQVKDGFGGQENIPGGVV